MLQDEQGDAHTSNRFRRTPGANTHTHEKLCSGQRSSCDANATLNVFITSAM